jgi:hypothetical protein
METPVSSIRQTGDLGGQKVKMVIDENALAHIMSVLTDLYSDPVGAVVREYSTNALDSHIEAGNTAPIEVFTPNALSPFFKVVDHGVGLSVDDITNMYCKYGASSKRETNEQVGMLGLGAKSALTLVPQFSLTSVKNGVKIFVSVSRAADGSGQMEIVDTRATDEPNGVEISIPYTKSVDFATKCKDFFKFWEPGTVLLDGRPPVPLTGREVGDKFIINGDLQSDYIVMGNVAYPVKDGLYNSGYYFQPMGIVARVAIGDINFTPSREALQYTSKTKQTIEALRSEFRSALHDSARKSVSEAESYAEAWAAATDWHNKFKIKDFTYKGSAVPINAIQIEKGKAFRLSESYTARYNRWVSGLSSTEVDKYLVITGFAASLKPSPIQREKARKWCEQQGVAQPEWMLVMAGDSVVQKENKAMLKYLDNLLVVSWEDLNKIKIERTRSAGTIRRTEPYDMLKPNTYTTVPTSIIDTSKPIIYYSPAELKWPDWIHGVLGDDAQIISLTKNRWMKFVRDFPSAKGWRTAIMIKQTELKTKLTYEDKILWNYSSLGHVLPTGTDTSKIEDPELRKAIEVFTNKYKYSDAAQALRKTHRDAPSVVVDDPGNPLTKYPLGGSLRYTTPEHALWYLNAVYNDSIKENS